VFCDKPLQFWPPFKCHNFSCSCFRQSLHTSFRCEGHLDTTTTQQETNLLGTRILPINSKHKFKYTSIFHSKGFNFCLWNEEIFKFNFRVSRTYTNNFLYQIINVGASGTVLYFLPCGVCSLEYHKVCSQY
jgi:hypothetical protein